MSYKPIKGFDDLLRASTEYHTTITYNKALEMIEELKRKCKISPTPPHYIIQPENKDLVDRLRELFNEMAERKKTSSGINSSLIHNLYNSILSKVKLDFGLDFESSPTPP